MTTATASAFEALRGASYWQNYYDLGGPLVPGGWTIVTSWFAILGTAWWSRSAWPDWPAGSRSDSSWWPAWPSVWSVIASGYAGPFERTV